MAEEEGGIVFAEVNTLNIMWLLMTGIGISMMQVSFLLLEAGHTQSKHVKSVAMKNFLDFAVAGTGWYLIGFGLFTGSSPFAAGPGAFFVLNDPLEMARSFQQFGFATTAVTIVSGAISGRAKLEPYLIFSFIIGNIIYPIVAHWAWVPGGWLYEAGFKDFSGSAVVHACGGSAALVYAYLAGPRVGRFVKPKDAKQVEVRSIPGHSPLLSMVGVLFLYVAWFSFNGGGAAMSADEGRTTSRAIYNTMIGSAASVSVSILYMVTIKKLHDLSIVGNCMVAGLVAITAPCGFVDPWAAIVIGALTPFVMIPTSYFVTNILRIDDPLDAVAVHLSCGIFGAIMTGFFDLTSGVVYTGKGDFLLVQVYGTFAIVGFTLVCTIISVSLLKKFSKGLSVSEEAQLLGMDAFYFGGFAFSDVDAVAIYEKEARTKKELDALDRASKDFTKNLNPINARNNRFALILKVLENPRYLRKFRDHMKQHHNAEGIEFLFRVLAFEREKNVNTRVKIAKWIISDFVVESAKFQVNLVAKTRMFLTQVFLSGNDALSKHSLFATAKEEVMNDLALNADAIIFLELLENGFFETDSHQSDSQKSSFDPAAASTNSGTPMQVEVPAVVISKPVNHTPRHSDLTTAVNSRQSSLRSLFSSSRQNSLNDIHNPMRKESNGVKSKMDESLTLDITAELSGEAEMQGRVSPNI